MSNPFLKKNPWMSLWLSGANMAASRGRGLWLAEARRQQQDFLREASKASAKFWTEVLKPPGFTPAPPPARKRRKAKR